MDDPFIRAQWNVKAIEDRADLFTSIPAFLKDVKWLVEELARLRDAIRSMATPEERAARLVAVLDAQVLESDGLKPMTPKVFEDILAAAIRTAEKEAYEAAREQAAAIAESEPRVWDTDAPDPQHRIAAAIRAMKEE